MIEKLRRLETAKPLSIYKAALDHVQINHIALWENRLLLIVPGDINEGSPVSFNYQIVFLDVENGLLIELERIQIQVEAPILSTTHFIIDNSLFVFCRLFAGNGKAYSHVELLTYELTTAKIRFKSKQLLDIAINKLNVKTNRSLFFIQNNKSQVAIYCWRNEAIHYINSVSISLNHREESELYYSLEDFAVANDRLYLNAWGQDEDEKSWTNIEAYDISDLPQVTKLGSTEYYNSSGEKLDAYEDNIVIQTGNSIYIRNFSDPANPRIYKNMKVWQRFDHYKLKRFEDVLVGYLHDNKVQVVLLKENSAVKESPIILPIKAADFLIGGKYIYIVDCSKGVYCFQILE